MIASRWMAGAALAALLGAASPTVCPARSPDLPLTNDVQGREQPVHGSFGQFDLDIQIERPGAPTITLDVVVPSLVPTLLQKFIPERLRSAVKRTSARVPMPGEGEEAEALQAQQLFEIGERCRLRGELEMARTYYQEAHLHSPTSHHGQLAIQRIKEMEANRQNDAEEQEAPAERPQPVRPMAPETRQRTGDEFKVEQDYRRVRERTQPLGTVEVETY